MYTRLVPLNAALRGKRYRPYADFLFARTDMVVEIVLRELPQALAALPLGFMRAGETGRLKLTALLSVMPGENSFINPEGRWIGDYVPAVLRGWPFAVVSAGQENQQVVCIDAQSLTDSATDGRPLFDADGKPAPLVSQSIAFWEQLAASRAGTEAACAALDAAGLVAPWNINVREEDGTAKDVTGFYRIDEKRLAALPAAQLTELRDCGALPLAYGQLFSRGRLRLLEKWSRQHAAYRSKRRELDESLKDTLGNNAALDFDF